MAQRQLRLLHAIHDFLPRHQAGSEVYASSLCRALAERHHVTVLCAEFDPARPHGHLTWRVHEHLPVVEIVNNWVCRTFADTYRSPVLRDRLADVLRAVQPDVLHVHNLLNLSFDLPALARAQGVPVVATLHDYTLVCASGGQRLHRADEHVCHAIDLDRCARCFRESTFFAQMSIGRLTAAVGGAEGLQRVAVGIRRRVPALAERLAGIARRTRAFPVTRDDVAERMRAAHGVFENVDVFVAPSRSVADQFVALGVSPDRVRVSDYGFDALASCPRIPRSGALRIGFVGTLVWHKGLHILIEAVRRLPAGSLELLVFGDPDVFPDYAAELCERAAGLPVRFMGPFERADAASVYAQFDVLVVPSLWLENSPLVIHEAFMAGIPVVGSRIGGIVDLVTDGWNGMLYDPGSVDDLSRQLLRLVEDPRRLGELAARLPPVKSVVQDAREWEEIYERVLFCAGPERPSR